jgi:hypothetical protein
MDPKIKTGHEPRPPLFFWCFVPIRVNMRRKPSPRKTSNPAFSYIQQAHLPKGFEQSPKVSHGSQTARSRFVEQIHFRLETIAVAVSVTASSPEDFVFVVSRPATRTREEPRESQTLCG